MFKYVTELKIVIIYFIFSFLWILFSDSILAFLIRDLDTLSTWQTYKGLLFITTTSLLLLVLINHHTSKLYKIQNELFSIKQRLEHVIKGANLGYWDLNYQNGEAFYNDNWLLFLGLAREDIQGHIADWESRLHPDDIAMVKQAVEQTLIDLKPFVIEFRMKHKDGHWVWIESSGAVVELDKEGKPLRLSGTHKNIDRRKKAEEKNYSLAFNDSLTNLPNRQYLKSRLDVLTQLQGREFAFLFLDLDLFKNINDLYGHSEGDKIINEVAKRFKQSTISPDLIARVGGDEFVILKFNTHNIQEECQTLINSLNEPFEIKGIKNYIGVSIGVSSFPKDGMSFEELFKNADIAMYEAKNSGKNTYKMYTSSMTEDIIKSNQLDKDIRKAIDNNEFVVHFQPQIDLMTNKIIGAEALVRWQKPGVGLIYPDQFIQKSEENRCIIDIGIIVFKKSLAEFKRWQEDGLFDGKIAINISAIQIEEKDFAKVIENLCEEANVAPSNIELEITESYIMTNPTRSIRKLQKLKDLGFKISLDDFGTGYSSLSYLKQLPLHKIKIDRSFIKDLPHNKEDMAISKAIIALGQNLELEILAEGVETLEQKIFLEANQCHSSQGYLFSKPLDKESFYTYLESKRDL